MRNSYLEIRHDNNEFPMDCFVNDGNQIIFPHWHKEIEIVYCTKGTIYLGINDSIISMSAGDIRIINGGEAHYYLSSPGSERVVLIFDPSFFKDMRLIDKDVHSTIEIIKGIEKSSTSWPEEITVKLQSLTGEILQEYQGRNRGYLLAIKAKMYEMILMLYRLTYSEEKLLKSEYELTSNPKILVDNLSKIFSYIEKNYQNKVTIEDIAQYLGFNSQYFTRYFKRLTGQTFVTFLNDYRLSKAKWLLLNEDLPIIEVASSAGFQSVKRFHHLFKEKFGTSPLKYRKSKYGNN
ncbi:AraC family transcriptional regulator [Neobacillus niacini]|uniref:AraC family transcriptional regulator n=1 Tax=Neobacillus niacini TaxID=86668 RepID=UPI002FFECDCB